MEERRRRYIQEHPPQSSMGLIPLTDPGAGSCKGEQGGLYPGGGNDPEDRQDPAMYHHPAESFRGASISRFGRGYAAPWDITPVLSCWPAVALGAGHVGRHIPPRAASNARVRDPGCGYAALS